MKANRTMGLIKRTVGYKVSQSVKYQLYNSLVRSKLEYCAQIWGGLTKANDLEIERIQRRATRYILNFCDLNYQERLCKLNLLPLTYRRDVSDIIFFHRCLYENCVNLNSYVNFTSSSSRETRNTVDSTKLCIPHCRTQGNKLSYFKRIVNTWNKIPADVRMIVDKPTFKRHVTKIFYNLLKSHFNVDNYCTWHLHCPCNKHF